MQIRPIRTDKDHRAALAEIEKLWGASSGTPEGDKLDVLVTLVETYEERRWPLKSRRRFDPVDVLHYAIAELGHTQAELASILGSRSRASEVLARHRPLTLEMIQCKLESPGRSSGATLSGHRKSCLRELRSLHQPMTPRRIEQARNSLRAGCGIRLEDVETE
jgi:HTH-type transcriptional regulator / antitoxin HigA